MNDITEKDTIEKDTIIITDKPAAKPAPPVTAADLEKEGLTKAEIESARKTGMIPKEDPKPADEKPLKPAKPAVDPTKEGEQSQVAAAKPEGEQKPKAAIPARDLSPAEEEVLLKTFGPGTDVRGLYFRMKNERRQRQAAEERAAQLDARLKALEQARQAPPAESGEDEDEKPLTRKALKEMLKAEQEQAKTVTDAQAQRQAKLASAHQEQEEYARSVLPDFDGTVGLATDLVKNLEALIQEPHKRSKVVKLYLDLKEATANADRYGLDDYNAAMIAYELGTLHPDFGKAPKTNDSQTDKTGPSKESPKGDGTQDPGKLSRIEKNTQRRASSASVPSGGGSRALSPDEVTLEDLDKMDLPSLTAFRAKHADKYEKLMRG
jgi:hypothetical protein